MRRPYLIAGAVLVALGAFSLVEATRLRDDWQGARLMPAVVGVLLVILGAAHFGLRDGVAVRPDTAACRRVLLLFAGLVAYVAVLPVIGFLPATIFFFLGLIAWLGDYSWRATVAWGMGMAIASQIIFKIWLGMPLPRGPFGRF